MYSNPSMDYAYHTPSSHQWSIPPTYPSPTPPPSFPSFPWELFTPYYTHGSSSPKFYLNHGYSPHTPTSYPPPPNSYSSYSSSHDSYYYPNYYHPQLQPTNSSSTVCNQYQTHFKNRRDSDRYLQVTHPCFKKYSQKSSKIILTKSKSTNTTKPLFTLSFKNPISDIIISHKNQTSPQKNYVFIDYDKPREECGVVGIYGDLEASRLYYLALHALQHSGQEGARIVTVNNNILQSITGGGLVSDVFNESNPNQSYNPATYCDSDFPIGNGVSCLPIPPEKGKQIVSELIKKSELNLKKGNQIGVLRVSNDDDKETLDLCRKFPKGETLDQISGTKETKAETEEIEEASLFQLPSEVTPGPSGKPMSVVGFDFCNESCIVSRTYSCNLEKDTTHYGSYEKGGIVALSDPGNFLLSDFSKFDRPPLLLLAFQALVKFTYELGRFPIPGVEDDAQKLIAIASHMNDISGDEKIDDINPKLLQQFALETRAVLNPTAAMFGGIVGQEVVKACSGKFHPGPFNDDKFHVDVDFLVPPKSPDFNLNYANSVLPPPAPTTVYSRYESPQFSLNILSRIPSQFILNSKNSFNFQVMITLGKYFVMVDQIVAEFLCCGTSEYRKYTETGFSNICHHMFVEIPLSIIQLLSSIPFPPKPPDPCFWLNNSTMLPPPSFKMWEYLIYKVTRCGTGYGLVPPKWRGNGACEIAVIQQIIVAINSLSKGLNMFKQTLDVLLHVLVRFPRVELLQNKVTSFIHCMVDTLGAHVIPYLPKALEHLLAETEPKQMSGFLLLPDQSICKFNILVRDILEEIFPFVADRIFSVIPREGLPSGLDTVTEEIRELQELQRTLYTFLHVIATHDLSTVFISPKCKAYLDPVMQLLFYSSCNHKDVLIRKACVQIFIRDWCAQPYEEKGPGFRSFVIETFATNCCLYSVLDRSFDFRDANTLLLFGEIMVAQKLYKLHCVFYFRLIYIRGVFTFIVWDPGKINLAS